MATRLGWRVTVIVAGRDFFVFGNATLTNILHVALDSEPCSVTLKWKQLIENSVRLAMLSPHAHVTLLKEKLHDLSQGHPGKAIQGTN